MTGEKRLGRTPSRERVRAYLEARGLDGAIRTFPQGTKTARMAAEAMGCELGQIVKTLVFVAGGRPVVALVAGDRRGDASAIGAEAGGDGEAVFADAETVRAATGYAIGGVCPFDLPSDLELLLDDSLERFEVVFPAAGTPDSMVEMSLVDLRRLTSGRVARISR